MSELVLYTSDDGRTRFDLRIEGQTVWLTQLEIAELFQTTRQNVSLHANSIFEDGELAEVAVAKESLRTAADGKRYQTRFDGHGAVSHEAMKAIAAERYEDFHTQRRKQEAIVADAEDLEAIEDMQKERKGKGGGG